jgi:hypothetical protein
MDISPSECRVAQRKGVRDGQTSAISTEMNEMSS